MAVRMNPYLVMDGNGREAVAFYEKALDARVIGVQTFGEMPPDPNHPIPDGVKDRILHALLKVGETDLMLSDTFPGMPYQTGNHVTITIVTDDAGRSKQIFDALAEGGQVTMPMQETFWSPAYGQVTDRFGVPWQITTEVKG
ncbi:MAG: VOC family protein [Bacillota bacterium]